MLYPAELPGRVVMKLFYYGSCVNGLASSIRVNQATVSRSATSPFSNVGRPHVAGNIFRIGIDIVFQRGLDVLMTHESL